MKKLLLLLSLAIAIPSFSATVTAKSWLLADDHGKIIQSENSVNPRSIGSITKLMTVIVVLEAQQNLKEMLGNFTRQQLIQLALVKSDNNSAQVLCENYPLGRLACVTAMNKKAHTIGMNSTKFVEPTGLSVMNISTAEDLVNLVITAKNYSEIVRASQSPAVEIKIKKRLAIFKNTNPLVWKDPDRFLVSKTGFINRAGGCIVMMTDTALGQRIVILLGSKDTHTRIPEAETILALK